MKFSQFTQLMRLNSRPDKEQIRKDVIKSCKPKWIKPTAVIATIVLTAGILGAGSIFVYENAPRGKDNHLPDELKQTSTICAVTTEGQSDSIATDSVFKITTQKSTDIEKLKDQLKVEPLSDYTLKKTSGNTFELSFDKQMTENTLYRISSTVDDKEIFSWAFQTESEFKITDHSHSTEENSSLLWVEFSHSDVQNIEQYFSITPAISGTFEKYANRWIFIPSSDFADGTVYTVTISGDVITDSGKILGEDYSFNFVSRGQKWCEFYYSDQNVTCDTFTTSQNPAGKISYGDINVSKAGVEVYSIPTAEEFISIHKMYVKDSTVSDAVIHALTQSTLSFETETLNFENDSYAYFGYPQRFIPGRYISVITVDGYCTFHFFQVNDTAAYTVTSGSDTAIWVTDSASGRLLTGIPVTADGETVNTDSNGIAKITEQAATGRAYYTVGSSTPYVCISVLDGKDKKTELVNKYKPYILTDSTHYKAKDTVKIKGFTDIKDASLESVDLYCSWNRSTVTAKIDKNGLIAEEIQLTSIVGNGGYIDLMIDGICVDTVFLSFDKGEREVYNVTVFTDKPSYIAGETVEYTFYAELADKTPAENVSIVSADNVIVTNSRGIATFSEPVTASGEISREFSVNQPDRQTQIYANYTVCPNGYYIKDVKDTNTSLTIVAGFADGFDDETETEVTLELHKIYYQSSENTAYFNPVTMQKEYKLRTYAVDEVVNTKQVTYDMITPIPYTIPADNNTYYMRITWGPSVYYHLISNREDTVIDSESKYTFVSRNELTKGDNLKISVLPYDKDAVLTGKVFVCAVNNGIVQTLCNDPASINLEFAGQTVLKGAYFDGKVIYPIDGKTVYERKQTLDITVDTEKDIYLPNDTVNGSISVTKDGIAEESFINVNVTDNGGNSLFFENIATDIAGKASFSFTLPKTTGDYTITVNGCANGIFGQATEKITASKDYYITPFVKDIICSDDDASFAFRVTAEAIFEACNYTVSLFKDGIQLETIEGTADYGQVKNESFGQLEAGHYTMTITSSDGAGQDSISCEFDVAEHLITDACRTTSSNISGITGNIRVHLYDAETELLFSVTDKMMSLCDADTASVFARKCALDKMGIEKPYDLSRHFTNVGFTYNDGSYATADDAAIITAIAGEKYDTSSILPYFEEIETNFPDVKSLINVYLVKAAESAPVLDELNYIYKQADMLEDSDLLRLALAYTYAGDSGKAWKIIDSLSPKIRLANGTATFAADTPIESDYLSSLCAIVTSKLSHTFAKDLIKGLMNGVDCELLGFAYYCFTEYYIPHIDGENSVIYKKADGSEEILTYRKATGITLDFSNEEYEKVSFESKEGDTLIMLSGIAGIPHQFDNASVISAELSQSEVADGDRFVITLDIDTTDTEVKSPYGTFKLPHGVNLIDSTILSGEGEIFADGNNIEIYYSGDTVTAQITCYAAVEGEYTIQAPILIDVSGEKYMSGTDTTVTVK